MNKPVILGLTGSIGMGKSTVAGMFSDLGVPVFDADAVVRRLQGPGGALLPAIEAAFPGTTGSNGLDRQKLGELVFGDKPALERLESIIHPAVADARWAFLAENAQAPLVVFDIPLLFEKGSAQEVDKIAVVSAPYDVQRERVLARPGMTEDRFAEILALQMPDVEKRARADFLIKTNVSLAETRERVAEIIKHITG